MKRISIILATIFLSQFCPLVASDFRIIDWKNKITINDVQPIYSLLNLDIYETEGLWGNSRSFSPKKPGDYFTDIYSGNGKIIDSLMAGDIFNQYQTYIASNIPKSILFSAQLYIDSSENGIRNEYFIRYTDGRFVYVLSGWWPKFIKYYKAIPQNITLTANELTADLKKILKDSKCIDSLEFRKTVSGEFYIIKGLNKNVMVRNYKISAFQYEGRQKAADLGQPPPMFSEWYNIIEITIYLDKEFIP